MSSRFGGTFATFGMAFTSTACLPCLPVASLLPAAFAAPVESSSSSMTILSETSTRSIGLFLGVTTAPGPGRSRTGTLGGGGGCGKYTTRVVSCTVTCPGRTGGAGGGGSGHTNLGGSGGRGKSLGQAFLLLSMGDRDLFWNGIAATVHSYLCSNTHSRGSSVAHAPSQAVKRCCVQHHRVQAQCGKLVRQGKLNEEMHMSSHKHAITLAQAQLGKSVLQLTPSARQQRSGDTSAINETKDCLQQQQRNLPRTCLSLYVSYYCQRQSRVDTRME